MGHPGVTEFPKPWFLNRFLVVCICFFLWNGNKIQSRKWLVKIKYLCHNCNHGQLWHPFYLLLHFMRFTNGLYHWRLPQPQDYVSYLHVLWKLASQEVASCIVLTWFLCSVSNVCDVISWSVLLSIYYGKPRMIAISYIVLGVFGTPMTNNLKESTPDLALDFWFSNVRLQ